MFQSMLTIFTLYGSYNDVNVILNAICNCVLVFLFVFVCLFVVVVMSCLYTSQ